MRVVVGEHFLRSRGSADVIVLLQEQDTQARAGQVGRRHETIMSGAQDDHVVFEFHCHNRLRPSFTMNRFVNSVRHYVRPIGICVATIIRVQDLSIVREDHRQIGKVHARRL